MPIFRGDVNLLEAFRRGERRALEQVYRAYVRMLDGYLRALARVSPAPELAQRSVIVDSLQEVFTRAFSPAARAAYDGTRPYGPYLRRIAKNYFIDQLRARVRTPEELFDALPDADLDSHAECEKLADPRVSAVLSAYLASLPPSLRGVYEQRFVHGKSQEDACSTLGVTRRRLRTEEDRLMRGLRRALVNSGIMRGDLVDLTRGTQTDVAR